MQYNYSFEIAALFFMVAILLHFILNRQFPITKTKVFVAFLMCSIFECVLNIASSVCLAYSEVVPLLVNQALVFMFFIFEGLCYYLFYVYACVVCEYKGKVQRIILVLGVMMVAVFELAVILTPATGFFYHFENGNYIQGFGADFGYYYIIAMLVLDLVIVICNHRSVKNNNKLVIMWYIFIAVLAIVVQYCDREVLLTGFAQAMVIIMMYLAIQNPGSLIDPITGIGNVTAFEISLENAIRTRKKVYVMTIDLRQFHNINTILGYKNGNTILESVARYLLKIGGKFDVFHVMEDKYNIIIDSKKDVERIAEQIKERFMNSWPVSKTEVMIHPVMVVCNYPKDFKNLEDMNGLKNYMLARVKKLDDPYLIANSEIVESYRIKSKIEVAMKKALDNKELLVYYQPLYSNKSRKIDALEALARIIDDELGFIPPDEFISIAEHNGSIIELSRQVIEQCCQFISKYIMNNSATSVDMVHINLSAVQCIQKKMADDIINTLKEYNIPGKYICLEITERAVITNPVLMMQHMNKLRSYGITFALDDYGTGNSNISYLIDFPVEKVKFDKKVVWSYFKSKAAMAILENEFELIHKLGIGVVTEGIEELEQAEKMRDLGVEEIQGYFYGKPMPEDECVKFLAGD